MLVLELLQSLVPRYYPIPQTFPLTLMKVGCDVEGSDFLWLVLLSFDKFISDLKTTNMICV